MYGYEHASQIAKANNESIMRMVRDAIEQEEARLECDLWPMVMSGIPAHCITIMRDAASCRYIGIMLDGERVCDGGNAWPKAIRSKGVSGGSGTCATPT